MARGWKKDPARPWGSGLAKEYIRETIYVSPDNSQTLLDARELARDIGTNFGDIVIAALEDYITLHQHLVTGETRRATLHEDYRRI